MIQLLFWNQLSGISGFVLNLIVGIHNPVLEFVHSGAFGLWIIVDADS